MLACNLKPFSGQKQVIPGPVSNHVINLCLHKIHTKKVIKKRNKKVLCTLKSVKDLNIGLDILTKQQLFQVLLAVVIFHSFAYEISKKNVILG